METFIDFLIEIVQPFPTHFCSASKSPSRIDRAWVGIPSSQLIFFNVSAKVIGTPEAYQAAKISDHSPLCISFGCKSKDVHSSPGNPVVEQVCLPPIPAWVFRVPLFKEYLLKHVAFVSLDQLNLVDVLETFNKCIKEAAR